MKHGLLYTLLIVLAIAPLSQYFSLVDFDKVVDNFRKIGFVESPYFWAYQ